MTGFNERVLAEGTIGAAGLLRVPSDKVARVTEPTRP
jgi:hypothetical protein